MSFPWLAHRSLADINETERLRARANQSGLKPLTKSEWAKLARLTRKEREHNPPAFPSVPRPAA